jgi:hypothetical protein
MAVFGCWGFGIGFVCKVAVAVIVEVLMRKVLVKTRWLRVYIDHIHTPIHSLPVLLCSEQHIIDFIVMTFCPKQSMH